MAVVSSAAAVESTLARAIKTAKTVYQQHRSSDAENKAFAMCETLPSCPSLRAMALIAACCTIT